MKTNEEEVKDEQEEPENIELKKSISEIHIIEEEDFPTERPQLTRSVTEIKTEKMADILITFPISMTDEKLTLSVNLDWTVAEVKSKLLQESKKKEIKLGELTFDTMRLIFRAKNLNNLEVMKNLVGVKNILNEAENIPKFYVMLRKDTQKESVNQSEQPQPTENVGNVDLPNVAGERPEEQKNVEAQPQRPLTKDEILMTQKFKRYEQKLLREYSKTIMRLESKIEKHDNPIMCGFLGGHAGLHRTNQVETNMGGTQNFLMSRLPLMEYGFQQRLGIYSAAENIRTNMLELNENNQQIVFLGYDLILQPTLFMKLGTFMIIFGMNAPGNLKWVCGALLICYYFNHLRNIFNDHYEQQRRMLNVNPNNERIRVEVNFIEPEAVEEIIENQNLNDNPDDRRRAIRRIMQREERKRQQNREDREQNESDEEGRDRRGQQHRNCCMKMMHWVRVAFVLVYFFILSLHHDWINPRLQEFDRRQAQQIQQAQAREQRRLARQDRDRAQQQQAQDQPDEAAQVDPIPAVEQPDQFFEEQKTNENEDDLFSMAEDDLYDHKEEEIEVK